MNRLYKTRGMRLLSLAIAAALSSASSLAGSEVKSDLALEWAQVVKTCVQPIGPWKLLRGGNDFVSIKALRELDRYERGVTGNPRLASWSYGSSIFNRPSFTLDHGNGELLVLTYPLKDASQNNHMGSPYVLWECPGSSPSAWVLHLRLRNAGTNVTGGDGIAVRVFRVDTAMVSESVGTVMLPASESNAEWQAEALTFKMAQGEFLVIQVDPKKDGYGDGLEIGELRIVQK